MESYFNLYLNAHEEISLTTPWCNCMEIIVKIVYFWI